MKNLFLVVSISFLIQDLYSQVYTRNSLIEQFKFKGNAFVIIEEKMYCQPDSIELNNRLKRINPEIIVGITGINNQEQTEHTKNDVIIIEYPRKLSKKILKNRFKELENLFTDEYISFSQNRRENSKDLVLYFNNKKIHHTETKGIIDTLNLGSIDYIYISKDSQNQELHGENGKNGVVVIWTKQELKKAYR